MEISKKLKNRICTLEQLLAASEVDSEKWYVEKFKVNSWEVGIKNDNKVITETLFQVKADLKPTIPPTIEEAVTNILKDLVKRKPKQIRTKRVDGNYLLELSLFDVHFGKLAWKLETGQNCDLKTTQKDFANSIESLLVKTGHLEIEQILIPIGQDFFNSDNWEGTTTKGTPQDNDSRQTKVFEVGCKALIDTIDLCLNIAPVKIIWVPGNHDLETSWYLIKVLQAWYRENEFVEVDTKPQTRKYELYGAALIGFTHGNEENQNDLPTLMATEVPKLWAASKERHWHLGHFHKKRIKENTLVETTVTVIPSISGTDFYHYKKGYISTTKIAEAYCWNKDVGLDSYFIHKIR